MRIGIRQNVFDFLGATVTWFALLGASAAFAQQAPSPTSVTVDDVFVGDSVELNPEAAMRLLEAARQAQGPAGCPLGAITIVTPEGDPIFQPALAEARRNVLLAFLDSSGIEASRFFADSIVQGATSRTWVEHNLDRKKPTLTTTSVPDNGSRVKPGDEITITMVARDDADPKPYQTGIKTLQLVADSEGGAFVASENYEPCADGPPPPQRRVVVTYTVPQDPPPIVRLSALAEDHAGLTDTDVGEFPTEGDWYGRIEWTHEDKNIAPPDSTGGTHTISGYADLTLEYDGRGNLTGVLTGSQQGQQWYGYPGDIGCTATLPPTPVTARVLGSYTPGTGAMSLQFVELEAKFIMRMRGTYGSHGVCGEDDNLPWDFGPNIAGLAYSLKAAGADVYRAGWDSDISGIKERWSLTLRRTVE